MEQQVPEAHFVNSNLKKGIIGTVIIVFCLFFGAIIFEITTQVDRNLKLIDQINIDDADIVHEKGVLIINDSVVLYGSAKQYEEISAYSVTEKNPPDYRPSHSKYKPILYDLYGPYKLIKKANNDTLIVIKKGDTLYFKFVDPDYKDPNDPTFSDLFEHWLKSKE